jgi:hypothetical protein
MYACPKCGNPNTQVERRPDGFCYCPDCLYRWKIGESQPKPTVVDHITQSEEIRITAILPLNYARELGIVIEKAFINGFAYLPEEAGEKIVTSFDNDWVVTKTEKGYSFRMAKRRKNDE